MYTDIDKKLMLKFLERNYPVSRIKDKQRFKRAIVIDNDTIYYLSDQTSHKQLKFSLVEILQKIFNCDEHCTKIMRIKLLLFIVLYCMSNKSFSLVKSIDSGKWGSASTWENGRVPEESDTVEIFSHHHNIRHPHNTCHWCHIPQEVKR